MALGTDIQLTPLVQVDFAYNSDAVLVTELDMELPPLHIHIIMLDALQLLSGHSFLEVGCSTGYLVGLAAYMVSPSGKAIGLEVGLPCLVCPMHALLPQEMGHKMKHASLRFRYQVLMLVSSGRCRSVCLC